MRSREVVAPIALVLLIVALCIGAFAYALWKRNMICRIFYPELNRVVCIDSNLGLPPVSR